MGGRLHASGPTRHGDGHAVDDEGLVAAFVGPPEGEAA